MSYSYAQPSSGALRILKPDFPEEDQHTMAGEYAPGEQPPTFPTVLLQSSHLQLHAVGQRSVTPEILDLSPPEETDLRPPEHSTNNLTGYDDRELDETDGGGGSFTGFLRVKNSGYGLVDPYGNGEGLGLSRFNQRPRSSIIGLSTDNTKFDPLANVMNTLSGNDLRRAYELYKPFDSDDEDVDMDD